MIKKLLLVSSFVLATSVAFANSPALSVVAEETGTTVQSNQSGSVDCTERQSGNLSCGTSYSLCENSRPEADETYRQLNCYNCGVGCWPDEEQGPPNP